MENQDRMADLPKGSDADLPADRHRQEPGTEFPDELLEAFISGDTVAGQSANSDSDTDSPGTDEKPTLHKLVREGVDAKSLYSATVDMPDGMEPVTVQELKDAYTATERTTQQRAALEADRTDFSNKQLKYMQELQYAVAALGPEALQDEKLAPVRQFVERQQAQEDRVLKSAVSDWDERKEGLAGFLASEYGAPQGVLDQPAPAWVRKALYDWWQLHERMQGISAKRKTAKASGAKRNADTAAGDRKQRAIAQAAQGGDKLDSIVQLLQG